MMVHGFVNPHAIGDKLVVNHTKLFDDLVASARFFLHLTFGCGIKGFAGFDMTLRH